MNPTRAVGGAWKDLYVAITHFTSSQSIKLRKSLPIHSDFEDEEDDWYDDGPADYSSTSYKVTPDPTSSSTPTTIAPSDLVLLPPTVFAFSLALREWGELSVLGFREIEFRNDAWDRLVIDRDYKELIRSLVGQTAVPGVEQRREIKVGELGEEKEEKKGLLEDVVEGKGGGLIIALHGHPGVGESSTISLLIRA